MRLTDISKEAVCLPISGQGPEKFHLGTDLQTLHIQNGVHCRQLDLLEADILQHVFCMIAHNLKQILLLFIDLFQMSVNQNTNLQASLNQIRIVKLLCTFERPANVLRAKIGPHECKALFLEIG